MGVLWHIRRLTQNFRYRKLRMGKGAKLNLGVQINAPERMQIGDNSYINGGVFAIGKNSKIIIGNDCLVSFNVHFRTVMHVYSDKNTLIREQGHIEKDIIVEDDVWVGYGAQIMPGITLHTGSVIGAGAVVTHDVPAYAVVAGVPARILKYRT